MNPDIAALCRQFSRRVDCRASEEWAFRAKQKDDSRQCRPLNPTGWDPPSAKPWMPAVTRGMSIPTGLGEVRPGWFGAEMVHPRYRIVAEDEPLSRSLTPVYPTTAGLGQAMLRKLVQEALEAEPIEDTLPGSLLERLGLAPLAESVRLLHQPPPGAELGAAWRRVKFDELLAQQLQLRLARERRRERTAPALPADGPLLRRFLGGLPFRLTAAQRRVMAELLRDLRQPHPMQRLLQGDVGSGKTIVAAIACLAAVDAGQQAAVMAPTEILAEQHYRKFSAWLEPLGVRLAWLHGGLPAALRKAARKAIAAGEAGIAIGTQALFQEGVEFARLALAIVDEQHRFGVRQRLELRRKSERSAAHQLMMSATPIPRTLAMSYYADLDVSVIDQLPPGRSPIATKLVADARREEVLARVREACPTRDSTTVVSNMSCPSFASETRGVGKTKLGSLNEASSSICVSSRCQAIRGTERERRARRDRRTSGRLRPPCRAGRPRSPRTRAR